MCGQDTRLTTLADDYFVPLVFCPVSQIGADDTLCVNFCENTKTKEISEGLLPHIAKPRQNYDKKKEERPVAAAWSPLFRLQLNRLEVRESVSI